MSDEVYNKIKETIEKDGIIHVDNYEDFRNASEVTFNERMRKKNKKFQEYLCYVSWEIKGDQIFDKSLDGVINERILKTCRDNWGKKVYLGNHPDVEWTLVGLEETEEDYYYIVLDNNGKRVYETCVGKITPVK